LSTNRKKFYG